MQLRSCVKCKSSFRVAPPHKTKPVRCPKCKTVNRPPAEPIPPAEQTLGDAEVQAYLRMAIDEKEPPGAGVPQSVGQYDILSELGRGGMGVVLKAHDNSLDRDVAIKMLNSGLSGNEESRLRFIREAQITGRLEHPGIVPVHALGADASGNDFFSMKLVSGRTLEEILRGWHQGDRKMRGEFSLVRLVSIFERVCETAAFAHSHEIIHRDIKPANIMIGVYGEVWIIDWGLAATYKPQPGGAAAPRRQPLKREFAAKLTVDGFVGGTPSYMAPEQAQGLPLDDGADIFALGGVLYEILTSKPPHEGESSSDVLLKAAEGKVTPVRETRRGRSAPKALAAIAEKCLAADRRDRYESVSAIIRDLRAYAEDQPLAALPENALDRLRRFGRRNGRVLAVGGSLAVMMLMVVTGAALS
ncbi:MAG TPA: protein kinase, partial [Planctomycetota bacterium]|nr:protein kinase [Planctomycetota bacterium]